MLPEEKLASIAGYYRRVTREAQPDEQAGRGGDGGDAGRDRGADRARATTRAGSAGRRSRWWRRRSALAATHTFAAGARLGARRDPPEVQSRIARSVLRDHLLCLPLMAAVLVIQLAFT